MSARVADAPSGREWTTRADYNAECDTCGWRGQERNALGLGAQHARRHGHRVHVEIVRARIYDYTGAERPTS